MKNEIVILGIGHNTPVYIDLIEACGYTIKGLYHYNHDKDGTMEYGYPILGCFEDLLQSSSSLEGMNFALSQGNNQMRADLFQKIVAKGGNIPTLIHPSANVSQYAKLGRGVVIHMNVIVHPDVEIGDNTVLSYNVAITHTSSIGKHCYFAASNTIGAYVSIEDFVFMGIGTILVSAKVDKIGTHAYIGAGAVLTKSVEPYHVMAGVPAKTIRVLEH